MPFHFLGKHITCPESIPHHNINKDYQDYQESDPGNKTAHPKVQLIDPKTDKLANIQWLSFL
jgi:hypothetical protein